jgi:RHS repeat-associated protein
MPVYYTKVSTPGNVTQILSVNYYDTYPSYSFNPAFPSSIMGKVPLSDNSAANAVSTKSLPVMSFVKNIEDDNWTKNYVYYDSKGRVIGTHSINHLGGYSKTESELDFVGVPQKSNVYHVRKPGEQGVIIKQRYVYDSGNRLLQHYHQVDDKPEELLSENTYNELSQITSKKVGNNLQSIDYTYNIRGWLTEVNKSQMGLADLGGKLFSYAIRYNKKNGIDNPDPAQFSGKNVTPKYNGNITEVDWRAVETVGVNPSLTPKRYGYAYDSMNRVTAGYYQNPGNPYSKENTESLSYDLNGNISSLYRTSVAEYGSNTATVIDNLNYTYTGNQATNINDISQNPTGYEGGGNTITYDQNGNMLTMLDKGINSIQYNYLNLPNSLHLNKNGNEDVAIITKYRADGAKLSKENTTTITGFNGFTTTKRITDYLDGFQYLRTENSGSGGGSETLMTSSMSARAMQPEAYSIVTDPTVQPVGGSFTTSLKTPDLQYLPTAEGFYDYQKEQYIYQYKDHLGNVRVSYGRNSAGALEITDANDYYPFGMNHLKTGNAFFGRGNYKDNKYNGKELQETGMYSYGWRDYMPDIARWNGIDQLAEAYSSTSTYAYVANNPVLMTDPDGRWMDDTGHITDTTGQTFGFLGSSYKPQGATNYLGVKYGDGGGNGSYTPFGRTQAYADLMAAVQNGGDFSLKTNNGYMSWWTGGALGDANTAQEMIAHMMKLVKNASNDWYSLAGKSNWFFGTAGVLSGFAGVVDSHHMYSQGVRRGIDGNYQLTGRNLSQFGKMAMTDATKPVSNIAKNARLIGHASFYLGVTADAIGIINGDVSVGKALINTGFGAAGNWGGSIGASLSTVYFGVDGFYPGGWPGMFDDSNFVQGRLDEGFNQAGPYRINVFGAHEPK